METETRNILQQYIIINLKISVMKKTLIILISFFSLQISAQQADQTMGVWYMYGGSHQLSEKFAIKSLAHFRFFEFGDDFQQLLIRVAPNYKISKTVNVSVGYAYFNTDSTYGLDGGETPEHRIYEDINVKYKTNKLTWAHRFRFEQRLLEPEMRNLFRYQLGFSHPIDEKWSAYLYDEIFFNFSGKAFNQNWAGLGVKYKLSNTVKLQLGYMKILNTRTDFDRIQLGFSINTKHF